MFGLLSAISWGAGDFAGGLLSRRSSVFLAILISQGVGLLGAAALVAISGEAQPSSQSIPWALAAGVSGVVGLGAFYYALSRGTMGVIAPLAALIGAGVPVMVSVAGGETVPPARLLGIALALVAVVLTSLPGGESNDSEPRRVRVELHELPLIVVSGLGFAGFFLFVDQATTAGEAWWPLFVVRLAGVSVVLGALLVFVLRASRSRGVGTATRSVLGLSRLRASHLPAGRLIALLLLTGLADLGGNAFFLLAKETDALSVAVVLSSLYPVVTTILAAIFLHERLRPTQIAGVALATVSVPLMR
ncbi:MAG TPA: EamA family transporter [Candidatus Limnocylindrales bacterium]|nr:EamA family transporter [Candidatus Limnocylindrales bacterium]